MCVETSSRALSQLCAQSAPSLSDYTTWHRDLHGMTLLMWTLVYSRPRAGSGAPALSAYPLVSLGSLVPPRVFPSAFSTQTPCITGFVPPC